MMSSEVDDNFDYAVRLHRQLLLQRQNLKSRIQSIQENLENAKKEFEKSQHDLDPYLVTAEPVAEIIGPGRNEQEFIVQANAKRMGPKLLVGCSSKLDKEKLTAGTRVTLDNASWTIIRILPPEVNPDVYKMIHEDPGNVSYSAIGGLSDQILELRESIEKPLINPEIFLRVGVKPPNSVLLYGPPGTGKTLLARAIASNIDANFLMVVSSAIIALHLGESARLIREMFRYAHDHQPCIIFMDEIDAIGRRRNLKGKGTSADREVERTLLELLNQLDGFDQHGKGFNGADLRNVCTEAGMFAFRAERDYVLQEDFMKAVRKLIEAKKLESSAHYNPYFGKD